MGHIQQLFALIGARNKEYYRDKGSLTWSFILPPVIIAVVALAFSNGDAALFKVGLLDNAQLPPSLASADYIETVVFSDQEKALNRIRHHQLDLLIDSESSRYIYNASSQQAGVLQQLIQQDNWQGEEVSGQRIRYIDWVIPGVLAMNLMFSGLYGVGYVLVRYRKNGVLKRLQATPISPFLFLLAQMLSRLMIMITTSAVVFVATDFFLNFLMLGSYIDLLVVAIVGNLCLLSMGLTIASRLANEELASGLLNIMTFPMLLLSELWFALDGAPAWMVYLSNVLPTTHMVQAARAIMLEGATLADVSHHLFVMGGMCLVFLMAATYFFKWKSH